MPSRKVDAYDGALTKVRCIEDTKEEGVTKVYKATFETATGEKIVITRDEPFNDDYVPGWMYEIFIHAIQTKLPDSSGTGDPSQTKIKATEIK